MGFNDQILIMNSSLLGDRAKDNNSFTQMLLRESEGTVIKITDLMQLNKGAARKFELGGGFATDPRWLDETWPLGVQCAMTQGREGPPSFLELRCSGGAGEHQGSKMGVYQLLPGGKKGNLEPVYRQMHNANDDIHYFLY